MTRDPVRAIADAVLYEGYVLWPYRRSALKNRRRWTFGGVHPHPWSRAHPDDDWRMRTECLVEGDATSTVTVLVRFLQIVERRLEDADGNPVDELEVGGELHLAWDEAREREVALAPLALDAAARVPFSVASGEEREELAGGAFVRRWERIDGAVSATAELVERDVARVAVEVENTTAFDGASRELALRHTLCSTHTVLAATGAEFVSMTDPPAHLSEAARACRNDGTWPVLVGNPGARDRMLSSRIILEDHPRIAPESPGDLFDGGEIDQLLTLNILALTDAEKREMRASDPRAREILDRTEALSDEELMRLHGTLRDLRVVRET